MSWVYQLGWVTVMHLLSRQWFTLLGGATIHKFSGGGTEADPSVQHVRVDNFPGDTSGDRIATVRRVNADVVNTLISTADSARRSLIITNDSSAALYLLLGDGVASTTNFTVRLFTDDYYEVPTPGVQVSGIWSAVNGAVQVTEVV